MATPSYLSLLSTVTYSRSGQQIADGSVTTVSSGQMVWGTTFPSALNVSTLVGSTMTANTATVGSTMTVSTLVASAAVRYSTLAGSTMTTNTMTVGSTLTGSTILASGAIGIGTVASAIYSNPTSVTWAPRLEVDQVAGTNNSGIMINNANYGANGPQSLMIGMQNAGTNNGNSYAYLQGIASNAGLAVPISLQPNGNNVGIGTTNPKSALHLNTTFSSGGIPVAGAFTNSIFAISNAATQYGLNVVPDQTTGIVHLQAQRFDTGTSVYPITLNSLGGLVGVGTTNPDAQFHIVGSTFTGTNTGLRNNSLRVSGYQPGIQLVGIGSTGATYSSWNAWIGVTAGDGAGIGSFNLYDDAAGFRVVITAAGNVGIGTTIPDALLTVWGSASKTGGGSWSTASDRRMKTDITNADLDRCYDLVKAIPLTHYKYKDGIYTEKQLYDRGRLGWIAQDVETYFPKAVELHPFTFNENVQSTIMVDGQEIMSTIQTSVTLDDCRLFNADQIYAAMYGTTKKLIQVTEAQQSAIASLQTELSTVLARLNAAGIA